MIHHDTVAVGAGLAARRHRQRPDIPANPQERPGSGKTSGSPAPAAPIGKMNPSGFDAVSGTDDTSAKIRSGRLAGNRGMHQVFRANG